MTSLFIFLFPKKKNGYLSFIEKNSLKFSDPYHRFYRHLRLEGHLKVNWSDSPSDDSSPFHNVSEGSPEMAKHLQDKKTRYLLLSLSSSDLSPRFPSYCLQLWFFLCAPQGHTDHASCSSKQPFRNTPPRAFSSAELSIILHLNKAIWPLTCCCLGCRPCFF